MPSTLLSWQFLVPAALELQRGGTGSSTRWLWEESDWRQRNAREGGSRKTALPPPRFLHEPPSALCFQETKVLERKDKSIGQLLYLVPLGSRVSWIRTKRKSKAAFEMVFHTVSGWCGFHIMLGRNRSSCLTETEITATGIEAGMKHCGLKCYKDQMHFPSPEHSFQLNLSASGLGSN